MNYHRSVERSSGEVPKYLFNIREQRKTGLPYRGVPGDKDDLFPLQNEETLTTVSIVRLAEALHARYKLYNLS